MSENYRLNIDARGAESGADRIVKSFEKIENAADKLERTTSSAFQRTRRVFDALSNIAPIRKDVINNISSLKRAVSDFRGPSQASVDSTLKLMRGLAGIAPPPAAGAAAGFGGAAGAGAGFGAGAATGVGAGFGVAGAAAGFAAAGVGAPHSGP